MSDRNLTYLQIPDAVKRRAKMAAAGLGVTLSEFIACAALNECARLGVKDIAVVADADEKEVNHE